MKIILIACMLLMGSLLLPPPALANAPTGPGTVLSLILLWLSVTIFSSIGGVYVIRKKMLAEKGKKLSLEGVIYITIAPLTIIIALPTGETMLFATLIAGGMALARANKMMEWSSALRKKDDGKPAIEVGLTNELPSKEAMVPTYLEGANHRRLHSASLLLIAATVILVPATIGIGFHEVRQERERYYNSDTVAPRNGLFQFNQAAQAFFSENPEGIITVDKAKEYGYNPRPNVKISVIEGTIDKFKFTASNESGTITYTFNNEGKIELLKRQ